MKKYIALIVSGLMMFGMAFANATTPPIHRATGFYLGAILGATEMHYNRQGFANHKLNQNIENGVVNSSGFGIRPIVGYQFNNYVAVEGSYTHYQNVSGYHLSYTNGGPANTAGQIHTQSFEFQGKLMYPLAQEVGVFAKGGLAYLDSRVENDAGYRESEHAITGAAGLGAEFHITDHFVIDASYNRDFGRHHIESADLFGIGFLFHF